MGMNNRLRYPSDVHDEEWAFVAPFLTLLPVTCEQRVHNLRDVFDALRWIVRNGATWRSLPHDFPPHDAVFQQMQRWFKAGSFEAMVHALREMLRDLDARAPQPSAIVLDARTLRSTPESGARAGHDAHKKTRGSKVHMAVDTLGHLLTLVVTPANAQDRDAVSELTEAAQKITGSEVKVAFVDAGYRGPLAHDAALEHGVVLEVVEKPEGQKGFSVLPKRWVVERSFAWMSRFRRLARDYERNASTLVGMHFLAFAILMLRRAYKRLEIGS